MIMDESRRPIGQHAAALALDTMSEGVLGIDSDRNITYANPAALVILGYRYDELAGRNIHDLLQPKRRDGRPYPGNESQLAWLDKGGAIYFVEDVFWNKDGNPIDVEMSAVPLPEPEDGTSAIVVVRDVSERKENRAALLKAFEDLEALNKNLETAHSQLLQSEKMASIGQLAAGVAHEINNPIGFVNSNLGSLKSQVHALLAVISVYERAERVLSGYPDLLETIRQTKSEVDFTFLQKDIQELIAESLEGVGRVKKIVDNLRDFSRADRSEWHVANLESGLESTLNIVWNELKYKAEIRREYAGVPEIECIASQLNQVFMNLLINAAQAIEERGVITVRTGFDANAVWVEVEDTGKGIKAEHMHRIFEPFFTTKPVGKGTGLGLSLAYGIVQQHKGKLDVKSEEGKGTVFRVTLPRERNPAGES